MCFYVMGRFVKKSVNDKKSQEGSLEPCVSPAFHKSIDRSQCNIYFFIDLHYPEKILTLSDKKQFCQNTN